MNPQDFINFFKTRSGKIIAFGALLSAALVVFSVVRKHHSTSDNGTIIASNAANVTEKPEVVQSVQRPLDVFRPSQTSTQPANMASSPSNIPGSSPRTPANVYGQQTELPSISLFADSTAGVSRPKKLGAVFAPFGRLIPCETIITVDSSSIQTPIVGLVTVNVYFQDRLVIPAGTEVHGTAQTDHQRERIASGNSWTLVWQDGRELQIKAIALDREFDSNTNQSGWAVTDGSAGLRGEIIKADNFADLKLFAATFLSGAASALTEQQQTVFGPVNSPSLNNAPFAGAQAVLQTYAQQINDSIQKNGFYVRVPSGKQFYLYVLQTIDDANASPGGTSIPIPDEKDEPTKSLP
jgi:hypothetical protein